MQIKTLRNKIALDRERFNVPRSVQDVLPVHRIWPDGIFCSGELYSKTFRFDDVNYAVAGRDDKERMFLDYSALLNGLDPCASAKITVINHHFDRDRFREGVLIPMKGDGNDKYCKELNGMLTDKANEMGGIVQDKYITISVPKRDIESARAYMSRASLTMEERLSALGSRCYALDAKQRLALVHDFMNPGEESFFRFDYDKAAQFGISFKDYIAPTDGLESKADHIGVGGKFMRVLNLHIDATYLRDSFIAELCELNRNMMLSLDILPMPTDEAVRMLESKLLGIETTIANLMRKQQERGNFATNIPYDLDLQRRQLTELLADVTTRDQCLMFVSVTLVHMADSMKELNADTETLLSVAQKNLCRLSALKYQQLPGFQTVLPFGVVRVHNCWRTLTTEGVAALMPFRAQEISRPGGVYIGKNALSHNLILVDREDLQNTGGLHFGVPGSGKSMGTKQEVAIRYLSSEDDIIICDPEGEFVPLARALGGEVIRISANSRDHINMMDMAEGYGEDRRGNPVIEKSQFLLSVFEQLLGAGKLGPREMSIIDRCVKNVYKAYAKKKKTPTLPDLRDELLKQPEEEAQSLALVCELFTSGSLNTFAHETNVDTGNRFIVYDIHDLGAQLKPLGLLVITDAILNRVAQNYKQKKRTHIFIDEVHVMFENEQSANFFNSAWRRFRKRGAYPNAITQNVEYLLASVAGRMMLSNSEYVMMYNQAACDRAELAQLLGISDQQLSYITNAQSGNGLLRFGSSLIPFVNQFPKDTELYKLMTTKVGEKE